MSKKYEITVTDKKLDGFMFTTETMDIDELEIVFPVIRRKFPKEEGFNVMVLEISKHFTKINPEEIFC